MKPNKYFKTWKNTNSLYLHLAGVLSNVSCKQKATSADCKSANSHLDSVHLFIYIYNMLNNWNELCWISISKNRPSKADHMVFGPFSSSSLGWGWFILKTDIFSPQLPSCFFSSFHWKFLWWWRWGCPSLSFLSGSASAVLVSVKCCRSLSGECCVLRMLCCYVVTSFIN